MRKKKAKYKLVIVRWLDAVSENTWTDVKDLDAPHEILSAGWLIVDNTKQVSVAASVSAVDQDGDINNIITIPRGMVVDITVVE